MSTKTSFCLIVIFFLLCAGVLAAQNTSPITVKTTTVTNGVVVVDVVKGGKGYFLECNQGAPGCTELKSGKYQLLELPPNSGMYDCKDVKVFAEGVDTSDSDKKLGEYCLNDK